MKNKIIISYNIVLAILFTVLFLNQNIGLNLAIFGILFTPYLLITHSENSKNKSALFSGMLFLGLSIVPFFHQSTYVFWSLFFSFFLFVGTLINTQNSYITKIINGIFNTVAFLEIRKETTSHKFNLKKYIFYFILIGISFIIGIIFILLYSSSNEKFAEIFSNITIRFDWIFTTLAAFIILYKISFSNKIENLTKIDLKSPLHLLKKKESLKNQKRKIQETQIGNSLLITLNAILIFYFITFFMESPELKSTTLSEAVHQGVNTLIISIIFAIGIILYFFRGNINFYKKNKSLKILSYIWITLNIILVFTTIYRNTQYIQFSGFTYKRFGVILFLTSTLIGLFTTFIKIQNKKTFWYLLKTNVQIIGTFLLLISFFNWNAIFTKFNLYQAKIVDLEYLMRIKYDVETFKKYSETNPLSEQIKLKIDSEYRFNQTERENQKWQEYTFNHFVEE
ncbi:DUF4153 domain-containing protein [Aureivirga marina]|uniref:DUF4153 domain-containing protein n=1 Tax=Aureivirga marina TaxID=1182451 RepID=UPI0018CB2E16|nr:DUF4153 domain-containing protein [Aureivirga marina]